MPDATHAGLADADRGRHGAGTPMGGMGRLVAGGHFHYALDQTGADLGFPPLSGRIFLEPSQAQSQIAFAPAGNFLWSESQVVSNGFVLLASGRSQHHAGAFDDARRKRSTTGPQFECCSLIRTQFDGWGNSHLLTAPEH